MASANKRIPTYHVVPRFDIAAKGGPLLLGTVVGDLQKLKPLNRGNDHVAIPKRIKPYTPVTQTGFRETRASLRSGRFGAWAKVLGLGLGGSATVTGQRNDEEVVSCEKVVTMYFDPDHGYVAQSLAAKSVHEYIVGSGYEADVFLVTGLKVAKNLSFGENQSKKAKGEVKMSAELSPTEIGGSGELTGTSSYTMGFDVNDIVVGFRVTRYRYKPASIFPWDKPKNLIEEDFVKGAEMYGYPNDGQQDEQKQQEEQKQQDEQKQQELPFEELPLEDEIKAQEKAAKAGIKDECWVEPNPDA